MSKTNMATSTKKSPGKSTKGSPKKNSRKKTAKKSGKNKLGVENSLVGNINARKKKGVSRPKKKSTVSKKAYQDMEKNWKTKK